MRVHPVLDHVRFRASVLVAVAALTSACNAVLGVEDVALDCHVHPDFPLINSSNASAELLHFTDGSYTGPELHLKFDTPGDVEMVISLYDNRPPHGVLNAPGTYQLVIADASTHACGICVATYSDFPAAAGTESWTYQAFGQGTMTLTMADSIRLSGSLHDLKFRHVMDSDNADDVELNDGCSISVEDVEFDVPYSF